MIVLTSGPTPIYFTLRPGSRHAPADVPRKSRADHVDSFNPTPAVGLYTAVGMRPDLISDIWRRTIQI
ncbi:hypothetical protein ACWCOV_11140 [Kribbella sp. NPDC002412]